MHTVDFEARIGMKIIHWPWSVFQKRPPICIVSSDIKILGILMKIKNGLDSLSVTRIWVSTVPFAWDAYLRFRNVQRFRLAFQWSSPGLGRRQHHAR